MLSKHCLYNESNSKLSVLHLTCRAIYNKLLEKTIAIPTSVQYWEDKIVDPDHEEIEWSIVYLLPRFATIDSYTRAFQYKIINNALFLNKKLSAMGVTESPECSLCKQESETAIHLFCQCPVTSELWEKLQGCLSPNLTLPRLTVKNARLGYMPTAAENKLILNLINHIILIFKRSIFEMRYKQSTPSIFYVINRIKQTMSIEYHIAQSNNKLNVHFKKWETIKNALNPSTYTSTL